MLLSFLNLGGSRSRWWLEEATRIARRWDGSKGAGGGEKAWALGGKHLRNVGIVAHVDAGKTTTAERMLFYGGAISRIGDVDDGDTAMDHLDMERERGITIQSASTSLRWRASLFNLVDTPGHVDFTVEVERAVRVLDGCVLVLDGVKGVQAQTVAVWRQLQRYGVPTVVFLNKMDMEGANIETSLQSLRRLLHARPLVLQAFPLSPSSPGLPSSIVDLVDWRAVSFSGDCGERISDDAPEAVCSPQLLEEAKRAREALLETLAGHCDLMAEALLEGREVTADDVHEAVRALTLSKTLTPVLCGSSLRNYGVQPLMDAVIRYLPDPFENCPESLPYPSTSKPSSSASSSVSSSASSSYLSDFGRALAFKVVHDHQKGLVVWLRVYEGMLRTGAALVNATTTETVGKEEPAMAAQLLKLDCESASRVEALEAGDIGALVGLQTVATGDTLVFPNPGCSLKHKQLAAGMKSWAQEKRLPGMHVPSPVFTYSVEALRVSDQPKLEAALANYRMEDPSVRISTNPDTGQFQISGMGELHLEIIADRLKHHYKVGASFGSVRISYHATLSRAIDNVRCEWLHPKVGAAALTLSLQRSESGSFQFEDGLRYHHQAEGGGGGLFPNKALRLAALEAIQEGVRDACLGGVAQTYGCPLQQLHVKLVGAEWGATSTPVAFRACAVKAISDAFLQDPHSVLFLQPKMAVRVEVPKEYMGAVNNDVVQRHGVIQQIDLDERNIATIDAIVPLSHLLGYSSHLRSMTRGSGSFAMEFAEYGDVNAVEQDRVIVYLRGS